VAEVVTIDTHESRFEPENRLSDPRDLLKICSGLVITAEVIAKNDYGAFINKTTELRLAHFSVREYLISSRIRRGSSIEYAI
jgi:hypothetical protein